MESRPKVVTGTATEARLASFMRLSDSYYTGRPINDPSVVRWRHLDGPSGPSATVELVANEETVGRMWIRSHTWQVDSHVVKAANPVDFLIHEKNRSLPAFMALFKATMDQAQANADLVYHTSNPQTDDLYTKLMKFKPVADFDGAVLPVRPFGTAEAAGVLKTGAVGRLGDWIFGGLLRCASLLSRLTGLRVGVAGEAPDAAAQQRVIDAFRAEESICSTREAAERAWRFRGAGPIQYRVHWLWRDKRPAGYVVTSDREFNALHATFVVDIVFPGAPSTAAIAALWLQLGVAAARRGRAAMFLLHNRANPRLKRLASGVMVSFPRARLPQRIPVFVRPSKAADPTRFDVTDWSSGYYLLADFDMF